MLYTRYADDVTFSTTGPKLPDEIATFTIDLPGKRRVDVGAWLRQIIDGNKFKINEKKVRRRVVDQRFEVSGLVVGRGVNVPREYVRGVVRRQ